MNIGMMKLDLIVFVSVEAITCYVCSPNNNNLCHPLELYGNKTECPKGVNVCYKSWSGVVVPIHLMDHHPL